MYAHCLSRLAFVVDSLHRVSNNIVAVGSIKEGEAGIQ
jgi:hypothetical protein